jgi:hypothetical protein
MRQVFDKYSSGCREEAMIEDLVQACDAVADGDEAGISSVGPASLARALATPDISA